MRNVLLRLLQIRLGLYRKFMVCRPRLNNEDLDSDVKVSLNLAELAVPSLLMLSGFSYERRVGALSYVKLKKHVKVPVVEELLRLLHLGDLAVPIPCSDYQNLFDCDVHENIVYEVWAPYIDVDTLETATKGRLVFFAPDKTYVRSFSSLVKVVADAIEGSQEAYVYAVSKFSQPGFLGRFLEHFKDIPHTKVVIATSSDTMKEAVEKSYSNVSVVYTRSHRKLLLILARLSSSEWEVLGFHGSMNVFAPGVDDYLVHANNLVDLSVVVHGLLRALLVV